MLSSTPRHGICMLVALMVLGAGLSILLAAPAQAQTASDVVERDRLIAAQEALLNVYRCRFDIDTEIVPGGCGGGTPVIPAIPPVPFTGTPNRADIAERDRLVAAQEALLNVYRCRFDIDTEIVPGGCSGTSDQTSQTTVLDTQTSIAIPVFYCAPVGHYDHSHLAEMVADLNQHVTPFFARESSELVNVYFTIGGIVSPIFDWESITLRELWERGGYSSCDTAAIDAANSETQILIILDIQNGENLGGYATYNTGPSRVTFESWGGPFGNGYRYNIAHELGHALFSFQHTDSEDVGEYDCSEVAWSVMNKSDECLTRSNIDPLSYYEILCWQKTTLGWPCFDPAPVVPGNTPRSYGRWKSYDSSRFDQLGVISYTLETEGLSDGSSPGLWMSCDYRESNQEWGLFAYVGWDEQAVFGDSDGDMRAEARFASGDVLKLAGYEATGSKFMNFHLSSSVRLFNAILQRDGIPVTLSTTDRDGKLYSATFDTEGAAIAVQSVRNFCDRKASDASREENPVPSGVWRTYEHDVRGFVQHGVETAAIETEGVADNNTPFLKLSCEYYESRNQWDLFAYVSWEGDTVFGGANGSMRVEARFSNGDILSLAGYEGTDSKFMNLNAHNSFRLLNAIVAHDGMPVTLSTTDRDGKLYSATFSTEGASVAVRSVMNYCEDK